MAYVTRSMKINHILISLSIFYFIHYTGATYIKKMLMENKKLQQLDISGNEIGDDGVRHVTEGLQQNDTVTELMLQWCNISVKGNYCNT